MASMNVDLFWKHVDAGFHYQYMRNALHMNNGNGHFSDIADVAGLRNTDWSWAPLFADYDNDGNTDLVVTNGYLKDTQDKDYLNKTTAMAAQRGGTMDFKDLQPLLKSTRLANFAFRGTDNYQFEEASSDWGFDFAGYSNGASYGDLDGDGDIDVVVNNFIDPACIYENTASDSRDHHYLRLNFEGPATNTVGLGTKVTVHTNAGKQYQEMQTVHGFQGTTEPVLHFGLGATAKVSKVEVEWPDGKTQVLNAPEYDQLLTIRHADAGNQPLESATEKTPLFREVGSVTGSVFTHTENEYNDFDKEILLPHKQSQNGPHLAVGDINNDGLQDFYIGGAAGQAGALFVENGPLNIVTTSTPTWKADAAHEDVAAHFFDCDGDGDQDLYVVSGGNEFAENAPELQDRLH